MTTKTATIKTALLYRVYATNGEGLPDRASDALPWRDAWEACWERRRRVCERGMSRRGASERFVVGRADWVCQDDDDGGP